MSIAGAVLAGSAFVACSESFPQPLGSEPEPETDAGASDASDADSDATTDADAEVDSGVIDCAKDRGADGLATHLSCAGLYSNIATKTVDANTREFTPGVMFWSDGAEKQRWVYLPPSTKIDISNFDEWTFPQGTRFWKEFELEGKRVETRLYEKTLKGWKHTSYRWNSDASEAIRNDAGEVIALAGRTPYQIPTANECNECHAGREEPVLGFEPVSLGLATAKGVTLATLAVEDRFSAAPPARLFTIPEDKTGIAAPALAWLHANCGHCHNTSPNAGAVGSTLRTLIRASDLLAGNPSAETLATWTTGVCKPSERDAPAGGKYLYIAGGAPSASLASLLLGARATPGTESIINQMPPLTSHMVDKAGQKLVDDWISALEPCP
ncbi:hypothetical protein [Labilithrix luteola]|nr:hypothetical protein [Labilithrix luteola]